MASKSKSEIIEELNESSEYNETMSQMSQSSQRSLSMDISTSTTPTAAKRKASPLYRTNVKQRAQTSRKSKSPSLSAESLIEAFNNPSLISSITPAIQSIIVPTVKSAIDTAVSSAVDTIKSGILKELIESNNKLKETIDTQMVIINKQQLQIDDQRKKLIEKSTEVNNLASKVKELTVENISIKTSLNDIEQYGRRNSLRFNNLKLDPKLQEHDMTKAVVSFINTHILSPDQSKISEADIDRCHPVGPSRFDNQQRQILVKFCSYHTKWKVFRSKSNLKKNKVKVFVCEDLTGANYRLVKSLSDLKKKGHLHSYWTTNGNVLAKLKENSPSIKVKPYDDFLSKLGC